MGIQVSKIAHKNSMQAGTPNGSHITPGPATKIPKSRINNRVAYTRVPSVAKVRQMAVFAGIFLLEELPFILHPILALSGDTREIKPVHQLCNMIQH